MPRNDGNEEAHNSPISLRIGFNSKRWGFLLFTCNFYWTLRKARSWVGYVSRINTTCSEPWDWWEHGFNLPEGSRLGANVLVVELDILGIRSAYHLLLKDEGQALYWATIYTQIVRLSLAYIPKSNGKSIHLSLSGFSTPNILALTDPRTCSWNDALSIDPLVILQHGGWCAGPHWQMGASEKDVGRHTKMGIFSPDSPPASSALSAAGRWKRNQRRKRVTVDGDDSNGLVGAGAICIEISLATKTMLRRQCCWCRYRTV